MMKERTIYLFLLILPFLFLIVVNESARAISTTKGGTRNGVSAINPAVRDTEYCSWACHDDTSYCKRNHVNFLKKHTEYVDPIYFGIIRLLKSTGDYGLANIVFLVVLIPGLLYYLLVRSIRIQFQINLLKANE